MNYGGSLVSKLNPWYISDDGVVLNHGRVMEFAVRFTLPSTTMLGEQAMFPLHQGLLNIMRFEVPEVERLRIAVRSVKTPRSLVDTYYANTTSQNATAHELARYEGAVLQHAIDSGTLIEHEAHLLVTVRSSKKRFRSYSDAVYEAQLHRARTIRRAVVNRLRTLELAPVPLERQEAFALMFRYLNPRFRDYERVPTYRPQEHFRPKDIMRKGGWGEPTLREQLVMNDLEVGNQLLSWDSYMSLVTMDALPSGTDPNKSSAMLARPCDFWLFIDCVHQRQAGAGETLDKRRKRNRDYVIGQVQRGGIPDIDKQLAADEAEGAVTFKIKTGAHLYRVGISYVLIHEDREALIKHTVDTAQKLNDDFGLKAVIETIGAANQYFKLLPLGGGNNPTMFEAFDVNAADFFPLNCGWKGSEKPVALFKNDWSGVTAVDPFDPRLPNANAVVVGGSGTGKTFFMQTLLSQLFNADVSAYILDVKQDYKDLVELFGGKMIRISTAEANLPNPFDLEPGQSVPDEMKMRFLLALVKTMMASTGRDTSAQQDAIISEAVRQIYAINTGEVRQEDGSIKTELTETPLLRHLVARLRSISGSRDRTFDDDDLRAAKAVADELEGWTKDTPYGRLVDRPTTSYPEADILYFDAHDLKDSPQLAAVGSLLIFEQIWQRATQDRSRQKIIVLDEVWSLLKIPQAASYVREFFKLIRSYGGAAYAVTQDAKDLAGDEAAGIVSNTSLQYALPALSREARREVADLLDFNQALSERFATLVPKKHVLLKANLLSGPMVEILRNDVSALRYWAFTSRGVEASLRERTITEFGGKRLEALKYLAERYPDGLSAAAKVQTRLEAA